MKRMENRVAIVTGASLGIGRATCHLFAREGAKVAVTDVLEAEGLALVREIESEGGVARFWRLNVAVESEVSSVVNDVAQTFGGIDVLINNAGILGVNKPTHEVTEEEWDQVQAVNVKGTFFCTKHVVPHMMKRGKGSIVNLSSIYGVIGAPDVPPYHASKGAIRLMTKTDALIYAPHGIRVNSIHPGGVMTPMLESLFRSTGDYDQAKKAIEDLHPIGRVATPEEIAHAILFLASDESSFVTGEELIVDGGYTAR
jgi:NAD(P)-dependent dehydrogenase (short-subunit alcohol dehydrogenase family)